MVARHPDDPATAALIDELCAGSSQFAVLWESRDVVARPILCTTFDQPAFGAVTVNCDAHDVADSDQRVVIHTAEPGSASEQALRLLGVVGAQRLDVPG